jgi:hypothetical protein
MSNQKWLLKPHELVFILGWSIRKVFDRLSRGKIPAEQRIDKGKVQFLSSPVAIANWVRKKDLVISRKGQYLLDTKAAAERAYWKRRAHSQMVESVKRAENRFRDHRLLLQKQQELLDSLIKQSAA